MLSPMDDYPVHQTAEPIRHVASSDRNFFDRYYFNCVPIDQPWMLAFGLGQYPNLGVTDAFAALAYDGRHRVVRASRELGHDRMDTTVGPLRVEVLEGLRRLRIVCEPTADSDLEFDLTWTAASPVVAEPRQFSREEGRVIVDSIRLGQTGQWDGQVRVGGVEFTAEAGCWPGFRDRSWGIRPVGEAEPKGIRANRRFGTFYWLYVPIVFEGFSILLALQEDEFGQRRRDHAIRIGPDGEPESLGRVEQKLEFVPGTRQVAGAELRFSRPGEPATTIRVEPLLALHIAINTGYGLDADWRHGAYQGPLEVQALTVTAEEAAARNTTFGVTEAKSRFHYDGPDGTAVGYGMFEYSIIGPHAASGFTGMTDTA